LNKNVLVIVEPSLECRLLEECLLPSCGLSLTQKEIKARARIHIKDMKGVRGHNEKPYHRIIDK